METPLRYHQAVFELLGREPRISPERRERIRELAGRAGMALPAAIVEWFELEEVEELFEEHTSTNDQLVSLDELGKLEVLRQGWMPVATENQGVVGWYAQLTGADDPPVYDNHDHWDEEDLSQTPWRLCSRTFSSFIFHMIAVSQVDFALEELTLRAEDDAPDEAALEHLRDHYTAGLGARQPDRIRHSFFNRHGRLTIRCAPVEGQERWSGSWTITAPSAESLLTIARGLWPFGSLASTLHGKTPEAEAVLEQLRSS